MMEDKGIDIKDIKMLTVPEALVEWYGFTNDQDDFFKKIINPNDKWEPDIYIDYEPETGFMGIEDSEQYEDNTSFFKGIIDNVSDLEILMRLLDQPWSKKIKA